MSEFPLEPFLAKILISSSSTFKCVAEALTLVAILSVPNIFLRPRE